MRSSEPSSITTMRLSRTSTSISRSTLSRIVTSSFNAGTRKIQVNASAPGRRRVGRMHARTLAADEQHAPSRGTSPRSRRSRRRAAPPRRSGVRRREGLRQPLLVRGPVDLALGDAEVDEQGLERLGELVLVAGGGRAPRGGCSRGRTAPAPRRRSAGARAPRRSGARRSRRRTGFGEWAMCDVRRAGRSAGCWASVKILSGSVPTSRSVPSSTPSPRSVSSRVTSTGLSSDGASSWMPPESVITRSQRRSRRAKRA